MKAGVDLKKAYAEAGMGVIYLPTTGFWHAGPGAIPGGARTSLAGSTPGEKKWRSTVMPAWGEPGSSRRVWRR